MTNEQGPRARGVATDAAEQGAWSLEGEKLSKRVPRFAAFVEATEGEERALTDAQQKFLDEFSSGLAEAISEEADAKGDEDG